MRAFEDFLITAESANSAEFLRYFLHQKSVAGVHVPPATPTTLHNAQALLDNHFDLIGERYELGSQFSWKINPSRDKEWQIAQHKCYWAVDLLHAYRATGADAFLNKWIEFTGSWLDEMGTGFITASDAQVEAKRIEQWLYAYVLLRGTRADRTVDASLLRRLLVRMAEETRYISTHLKATRNHRTFQLFAVCLSSVIFPECAGHDELARFAIDELTTNLLTDILPDGVHVEQSTHYHQLVLETAVSFLELTRANGIAVNPALVERVERGLEFCTHVEWPNGQLPLVNDSDDGSQEDLLRRGAALFGRPDMLWVATRGRSGMPPSNGSACYEQAGYFVFRNGWGRDARSYADRQHVFYDCGRLGEGSHSHYDLFNFCYYVGGAPAIVDPGRYTYDSKPVDGVDWRKYFKSTASHNTVTIDGQDQTRYVSRTKHGPDVQVRDRRHLIGSQSDWVSAAALSAEYAPVHERFFLYMQREYLWIVDRIDPVDGQIHEAGLRFHLSDRFEGCASLVSTRSGARLTTPEVVIHVLPDAEPDAAIESGWMSTSYGVKRRAPVLSVRRRTDQPCAFASVVAPRGTHGVTAARVTQHYGVHDVQVNGSSRHGTFHDTLLATRTAPGPDFEVPGVQGRARNLAIRRDASGRVVYVVGSGVERLDIEGHPVDVPSDGTIEWTREVW